MLTLSWPTYSLPLLVLPHRGEGTEQAQGSHIERSNASGLLTFAPAVAIADGVFPHALGI
jgi:hypothetical protein